MYYDSLQKNHLQYSEVPETEKEVLKSIMTDGKKKGDTKLFCFNESR